MFTSRPFFLGLFILIATLSFWPHRSEAKVLRVKQLSVDSAAHRTWSTDQSRFVGSLAAVDIDADGIEEVAIGAPAGERARVTIRTVDGTVLRQFSVLDGKFKGGVNVAAADVDADGVDELIVSTQPSGPSQVVVYELDGTVAYQFNAYNTKFREGVNIAVGDVTGDGQVDIITTASGESNGHTRRFTSAGQLASNGFYPYKESWTHGANVAVGNVVADSAGDEIVIVPRGTGAPVATILNANGTVLKRITVFSSSLNQGLTLALGNTDADAELEIIVSPRHHRGDVRIFEGTGTRQAAYAQVFGKSFRGSVGMAFVAGDLLLVPQEDTSGAPKDVSHYVDVNLTKQELRYYEWGVLKGVEKISSGLRSMPTPTGTFKTRNKIRTAYSKPYNLYMDYWMAFTGDGKYGLHSLPFWKLKGGGRVYEGTNHLGTPVSHGCIRLSPSAAAVFYSWAPIGTTVYIHK